MYATEANLVVCLFYDDHALVLKLLNALLDHIAKLWFSYEKNHLVPYYAGNIVTLIC